MESRGPDGAKAKTITAAYEALSSAVESADAAPTEQDYQVFDTLSGQLDGQLARWKEILSKDLGALNDLVRKEGIPPVAPAPHRESE